MIKHDVAIVDVFSSPASNGLQNTSIFAHFFLSCWCHQTQWRAGRKKTRALRGSPWCIYIVELWSLTFLELCRRLGAAPFTLAAGIICFLDETKWTGDFKGSRTWFMLMTDNCGQVIFRCCHEWFYGIRYGRWLWKNAHDRLLSTHDGSGQWRSNLKIKIITLNVLILAVGPRYSSHSRFGQSHCCNRAFCGYGSVPGIS